MNRLTKAAKAATSYEAFELEVLRFLRWYQVPREWTRASLKAFYQQQGGK